MELQQQKQDCDLAQSFNIVAEQDPCILPGHVSILNFPRPQTLRLEQRFCGDEIIVGPVRIITYQTREGNERSRRNTVYPRTSLRVIDRGFA